MKGLDELNDHQLEAVTHTGGPLLILAGAGSGKTKTLTYRIAYLIDSGTPPARILAVTFTNKAAEEMRKRISSLVGNIDIPFVGTFHSLCVRILRESGGAVGIARNFTIYDSSDQLGALKQAMKKASIDEKEAAPRTILHLISSAKNELITPGEYATIAQGPMQKLASQAYPLYQEVLKSAQALDFDDLLMQTARLLSDPVTQKRWASRFDHIMIDEYQDTNAAQYEIVKLLAHDNHNICVVGDDWQSIYSWRGADYRTILNFERDWPETTIIKLEQNYRSTKHILNAAHQIISHNQKRSNKKLWTQSTDGQPVRIVPVMNERHEAEVIISHIKAAVDIRARDFRDFAILYRTNAQSRALEDSFVRYGLPYRIIGGTRFYDRQEIKDLVSYVRFIFQPSDRIAFERMISIPPRGIGKVTTQKLIALAESGPPTDLIEAIEAAPQLLSNLTAKARQSLSTLDTLLKSLRTSELRPSELIHALVDRLNYFDYLDDGTPRGEERIENVKELLTVAKEYDAIGIDAFLEEVALMSDIDTFDTRADAVVLMTVHAAKGLEFPVVFMAGMEDGIFPHSRSQFELDDMEEERRLCYVGMTRAREELIMLHASSRTIYGNPQAGIPSRFLKEIEAESAKLTPRLGSDKLEADIIKPKVAVKVGDNVRHPVFGEGVIRHIDGESATIAFRTRGSKILNLAFAPLEKIR